MSDDDDTKRVPALSELDPCFDAPAGGGTEVISSEHSNEWNPPSEPGRLPVELPRDETRYQVERELARGSMGVIQVARDLTLQRLVALKRLNAKGVPGAAARFFEEARITAQLQHPGIVAIYEIDKGADGRPFFSMQLVEGHTLEQILDGLREGHPEIVREFTRIRLLNIFNQICMTVAYAHSRGVIHRDLKPSNIMLGEYGEVFVMDWGLAKIIDSNVLHPVVGGRPDDPIYQTRVGDITGTPRYMSPEQAMGLIDALNERSDIYSLGALLFEILTQRPAHTGKTVQEVLRRVRSGQIRTPSSQAPDVPAELDAVVLRCMAFDQIDRYASARELRDQLEAWLEGGRTSMHRVRRAAQTMREAIGATQEFKELARLRRRSARAAAEAASLRLPSDSPEMLRATWDEASLLAVQEREVAQSFERAVARFAKALTELPTDREAHEGLRDLYWYRFLEAERRDDAAEMQTFRALATLHDPRRALEAAIEGNGALRMTTDPPSARVILFRIEERERRWSAVAQHASGRTPWVLESLPMGRYAAEVHLEGYATLRFPVTVERQETVELSVVLVPHSAAQPNGLAHIPGGPFWHGASGEMLTAAPRARVRLDDFFIAEHPITVEDYATFLRDLAARDPTLANRHAPRGEAPPLAVAADGTVSAHAAGITPVTHVSWRDAQAYAKWRAERDGLRWRLPTEFEWEKAARGTDGRAFPWGANWEPTFCCCIESPEGGVVAAVGHPDDISPYGVHDLAGGVREWTSSEHPRDVRRRVVRGGSFATNRLVCHAAARQFARIDHTAADLGFRLAVDFSIEGPSQREDGETLA